MAVPCQPDFELQLHAICANQSPVQILKKIFTIPDADSDPKHI